MIKHLRLFSTLLLLAVASAAWGETTTKYNFVAKNWNSMIDGTVPQESAQWSGTKDGNQFNVSNTPKGVQVTTSGSGVVVTSPKSFTDVNKIVLTYSSSSKGVGSIEVRVGEISLGSQSISKSQVETELTYESETPLSGNVSFVVTCTTNSMGINAIAITEAGGTIDPSLTTTTIIQVPDNFNTDVYTSTDAGQLTATVTADGTAVDGATVTWSSSNTGVATINDEGIVTLVAAGTTTITASYAGVEGEYKASQDTYEITVTSSAPYTQPTTVEANLNNSLFGTNYTGTASGITDESPETGIKDNVTIVYAGSGNHYINDSQIRFYPSNKLTFTAPEGYKISSIVFTSDGTWAATISANVGTYTASSKTWTGNASSVVFTGSGSSRCDMSKATITLTSADAVTAPVISGTTPFLGSTEVTITAEQDATIYYTTNGDEPTTSSTQYSAPFTLEASATVKAIAVKSNKTSEVAEMAFVKTNSYKLNETSGLADGDYYLQFDNAVVTYVKGAYNYIEDDNGAILYYKSNSGLKAGDVINGYKLAKVKTYSGQFEATSISDLNATAGEAPQPTVITIADLLANTASNMSKYVKLEDVAASTDGEGFILSQNGSTIAFYGRNGAAIEDGKSYDIIGFLSQHNSDFQFMVHEQDDISEIGVEYSEAPVITVSDGTEGAKVVTITAAEGANIYYTKDGTTPSEESNKYTEPLTFTEVGNYTISAIAIEEGKQASTVVTSEFEIVAPPAPAIIDLSAGQSISTIEFPSFNGNGYQTLSSYEIVMSDGNAYSWNVNDAMKNGNSLQLKASSGQVGSPVIKTPYGFVVTATYTSAEEMTLTSGETSASGAVVDEDLGTHEVALTVESAEAAFTLATGSKYAVVQSITITALSETVTAKISAAGYSTLYYGTKNLTVPEGMEAYTVKVTTKVERSTTYNAGDVIPAGTGVVLKADKGDYVFTVVDEAPAKDEANMLRGSDEKATTTGGTYYYALTLNADKDPNSAGFYWMKENGAEYEAGAHKAYLALDKTFAELAEGTSTGAKGFLSLPDDDTDGIGQIENGELTIENSVVYDLSGRKLNEVSGRHGSLPLQLPKGIYIVNGKKVVVK